MAICLSTLLPDPLGACTPTQMVAALDAAAVAGFDGVSVWTLHALLLEEHGVDAAALAELIAERGLRTVGVEAVTAWASTAEDAVIDADAHDALRLAAALGATDLLAVTMEANLVATAATGLARVADAAAETGCRLGLEFLPWSGLPDLPAALDLLTGVDRPNVGLTLDVWHWDRSGAGAAELAAVAGLDPSRLVQLQLDDVRPEPPDDLLAETMTRRLPPGEGAADIPPLLDAVRSCGADPVVCCEVFHTGLLAQGPEVLARRVAEATRTVLS